MSLNTARTLSAALLTTVMSGMPALCQEATTEKSRTPCFFNQKEETCDIRLKGDDIELRLEGNRTVEINRRGRCTNRLENSVTIRSCNVRIGLPNDFVYGLIVRRSTGGTMITSPQLEIKLPEVGL